MLYEGHDLTSVTEFDADALLADIDRNDKEIIIYGAGIQSHYYSNIRSH